MVRPNFVADEETGHPSIRPGIEADRALYSHITWEGEGLPADPNDPGFQEPAEFARPDLVAAREKFLERFQSEMIS